MRSLLQSLNFNLKLRLAGVSDSWIRQQFSWLAQIDSITAEEIAPGIWVASGSHVEVVENQPDGVFRFTMNETPKGEILVHEWSEMPLWVEPQKGFIVKTNWKEVYRSNNHCKSLLFTETLKRLPVAIP